MATISVEFRDCDGQWAMMRLTRMGFVSPGSVSDLGVVGPSEFVTGVEERTPRVLVSATVRVWCQPPTFYLSHAEIVHCGLRIGPAGLSSVGGRSTVSYLERVIGGTESVILRGGIAEGGVSEVVIVGEHLE